MSPGLFSSLLGHVGPAPAGTRVIYSSPGAVSFPPRPRSPPGSPEDTPEDTPDPTSPRRWQPRNRAGLSLCSQKSGTDPHPTGESWGESPRIGGGSHGAEQDPRVPNGQGGNHPITAPGGEMGMFWGCVGFWGGYLHHPWGCFWAGRVTSPRPIRFPAGNLGQWFGRALTLVLLGWCHPAGAAVGNRVPQTTGFPSPNKS